MSRKQKWGFALQIVKGPNAGLCAGSWRIWTQKNDIYVAAADMGNIIKASLHVSGRWRVAYTSEHMSGDQPLWDVSQDRAVWRFPAPPFIDDVQAAFAIATWRNALRPCTLQPGETLVEIADRWDVLSGVKLMVTEPDKACPIPETLVFDVPLVLSNGRRLWLNRFEDGVAPASPEPVPAGQLIRL